MLYVIVQISDSELWFSPLLLFETSFHFSSEKCTSVQLTESQAFVVQDQATHEHMVHQTQGYNQVSSTLPLDFCEYYSLSDIIFKYCQNIFK